MFVNLPTGFIQCGFPNTAATLSGIEDFFQLPAAVIGTAALRTVAVGLAAISIVRGNGAGAQQTDGCGIFA